METNKARYETPSAKILFVTVERIILQSGFTTLADDTYEEEDA